MLMKLHEEFDQTVIQLYRLGCREGLHLTRSMFLVESGIRRIAIGANDLRLKQSTQIF
jgi:hypothetical protein